MLKKIVYLAAAVAILTTTQGVAVADDTGFASIHTLRKERGKLCMADHFHSGEGQGRTTRRAKRAAAIDWGGFTGFEYGTDWARFSRAGSRTSKCGRVSGGWSCQVEARPCRRLVRRAKKK